jgi:hypothetical protein
MEIQRSMLAANLRTSQEALAFLGRLQSLETTHEAYKKAKHELNSKDADMKQYNRQIQGGSNSYRENPRNVRQVRYGGRQANARVTQRENTPFRERNFQAEERNIQPTHEFNPQMPEFNPRNTSERGRPEQVDE